MTKRTRRDLSDPRIKRIIKHQEKNAPSHSPDSQKKVLRNNMRDFFTAFFLVFFIGSGMILVYQNWPALQKIFQKAFVSGTSYRAPSAPPGKNGASSKTSPSSPERSAPQNTQENSKNVVNIIPEPIQVEILNGCGRKGIAEQVTKYLRKENIDVVARGNYPHFEVKNTYIIDHIDKFEHVKLLANLLGISVQQIKVERDKNLQLDATIILGADYTKLYPFKLSQQEF